MYVDTLSALEFPRLQTKISSCLPHRHLKLKMSKTKLINFPLKSAFSYVSCCSEWPHNVCDPNIYLGAQYHLGGQRNI